MRSYPSSRFLTERYVSYTSAKKNDAGNRTSPLDMNALMYLPWPFLVAYAHYSLLGASPAEVALCLAVSAFLVWENEYMHQQVHLHAQARRFECPTGQRQAIDQPRLRRFLVRARPRSGRSPRSVLRPDDGWPARF